MLEEICPSAKRKRAETDSPEATAFDLKSMVRSPKLWMPYGDFILRAESTLFRVNRDVLARHSSVFREMFAAQPPNEPTIEGCPIVIVVDTAADWELLLERLYDRPFQNEEALSLDLVGAMLRLGTKYAICTARENAVWRIHQEFPVTLESWDEMEAGLRPEKIRYQPGFLVEVLKLVYEGGIRSSIPITAFCCVRAFKMWALRRDEILRKDGSRITLPEELKGMLTGASEPIAQFDHEFFRWLTDDWVIPREWCISPIECRKRRGELHGIFTTGDGDRRYHTLSIWHADSDWSKGLCEACEVAGRTRFNSNRHMAWDALPRLFGLPPWTELKDL
ncbi:hypothetical protein C8F04DRAFT_1239109 [Mycena alexandri]|uniref:BTB domain-containing protein n=1 Tax=Mycena alexandri TaxID=1745969 RepID=A0AAD6S6Q1_9AGAR|nr:hypothetical protein C8F04DRAFT_1242186 [Mycena alexandri]KAJ7025617.1 hypothetical protein C8F04DRAFT_1239109 [Mycena alexandri]